MTQFVPPLAAQLVERFELVEIPILPPPANRRLTHAQAIMLWGGTSDEGPNFASLIYELYHWKPTGWKPTGHWAPNFLEWYRVHDPKDDPDESGRYFYFIRLTYLDGDVYVALYGTLKECLRDMEASAPPPVLRLVEAPAVAVERVGAPPAYVEPTRPLFTATDVTDVWNALVGDEGRSTEVPKALMGAVILDAASIERVAYVAVSEAIEQSLLAHAAELGIDIPEEKDS